MKRNIFWQNALRIAALATVTNLPHTALAAQAPSAAPRAAASCEITQDDGKKFTLPGNCTDMYVDAHYCHDKTHQLTKVCQRMNALLAVNLKAPDMIIVPHRGVFGMRLVPDAAPRLDWAIDIGGPAENSWGGAQLAQTAGFNFVEYDVLMQRAGSVSQPPRTMTMTHYTDLRAFTTYSGAETIPASGQSPCAGFLMCSTYSSYQLRDRDGAPDPTPGGTFDTLASFLGKLSASGSQMVLIIDLKYARGLPQFRVGSDGVPRNREIGFIGAYTPAYQEEETIQTVLLILKDISSAGMDGQVVIKIPEESVPDVTRLFEAISAAGLDARKILWSPTPDPRDYNCEKEDCTDAPGRERILNWVDSWADCVDMRQIAYWDTSIPSYFASWATKPFTRNGREYSNLANYLYQRSQRRPAVWTPDPSGPAGRHGNFAMSWYNNDDTELDFRGDGVSDLSLPMATHALVTSDRPDLYLQIRKFLQATSEGGNEK